jgi:cyclopropane-fatty-acyl-phospholipid synthase
MADADKRVHGLRQLAAHLAELLHADLSLKLWTGEQFPLGPRSGGDLCIAIRTPAALTRLVRRPKFVTLIELLASGDLELEGGTLLDFAARRGSMNTKGLWRRLDKGLAFRALAPFLFGNGSAQTSGTAYSGPIAERVEQGRDDSALIRFHYDLSNEFYGLFLDPEMVYTCAYFPQADTTLAQAQQAKLDMICRKLRLQEGERFLDIGCGWGGLVCHAAQHYGVKAHGVTLAQEQFSFAQAKIARLGLAHRVTVELRDYRSLDAPESFDKIASIGMFEAVGLDNHHAYFSQMYRLLRPRGLYLHHSIARPAKRNMKNFRKQRPEYAALTRYIFPGGELDTVGMSINNLEAHGFEVHDVEAWREHYERTTRVWTENLYANRDKAAELVGWPKTRLWLLYLAGCSLSFQRSAVGIFQTLASKKAKGASGLPPTRADLYR